MDIIEKAQFDAILSPLGININDTENTMSSFNITQEFKDTLEPKIIEYCEKYAEGEYTKGEFTLTCVSLGKAENERIYLAIKAIQMYLDIDEQLGSQYLSLNTSSN